MVSGCGGGGSSEQPVTLDCTLTAQWQGPTERENDDPLEPEEIRQFTIFGSREAYSGSQHEPDYTYVITDPYVMLWEIRNLPGGTHWVWMTATDTGGLESAHSNVQTKVLPGGCGP